MNPFNPKKLSVTLQTIHMASSYSHKDQFVMTTVIFLYRNNKPTTKLGGGYTFFWN